MVLALHKAAAMWRESSGLGGMGLLKVLIRDQAIYFLAWVSTSSQYLSDLIHYIRVIFVSVLQIIDDVFDQSTLVALIFSFVGNPTLLSLLGARLLLNMKEAGEKGLNQGTSCGSKSTVSEVDFAEAPQASTEHSQEGSMQNEVIELEEIC